MSGQYTQVSTEESTFIATSIRFENEAELSIRGDGKYSYAYGPRGLNGLLVNAFAFRCALFASLGGLTFGYDQGVIANILVMKDFVERWPITPWQKGVMTAVLELGALLGALAAGVLVDRLSRRGAISFACAIFCVGSALQTFADSISTLTLGRAVGGIGIGALSMLCPLYIGEIAAPETRGSLLALEQLSIVLGVVLGFWFGYLTRSIPGSASWRLPLGIQILPGILLGLGCFSLPPSPRFLIQKGDKEKALSSLARLRFPDTKQEHPLLDLEFLDMQVEAAMLPPVYKRRFGTEVKLWMQLFKSQYFRRTLVGIMMMFWQQWSGINALLYYGPSLIQSIGLTDDTAMLVGSGFINIAQFVAVFPTILFIDQLGRKPLLIGGAAIMGCSHAIISFLILRSRGDWANHKLSGWISLGCIYIFTVAYGASFGPVAWVLTSEIFPLSVRSRGISISTASNWVNNFLIGLVTPSMLDKNPAGTYLVFALACFAACAWSILAVPETAGASLEEIDRLFNSSVGRNDRDRRKQLEEEFGVQRLLRKLVAHQEDNE